MVFQYSNVHMIIIIIIEYNEENYHLHAICNNLH